MRQRPGNLFKKVEIERKTRKASADLRLAVGMVCHYITYNSTDKESISYYLDKAEKSLEVLKQIIL